MSWNLITYNTKRARFFYQVERELKTFIYIAHMQSVDHKSLLFASKAYLEMKAILSFKPHIHGQIFDIIAIRSSVTFLCQI